MQIAMIIQLLQPKTIFNKLLSIQKCLINILQKLFENSCARKKEYEIPDIHFKAFDLFNSSESTIDNPKRINIKQGKQIQLYNI